jgi:phosphoserine phosphatase
MTDEKLHIVWDYDGTILPFAPYDSEQYLLDYLNSPGRTLPYYKKIVSKLAIYADNRELLGHSFKKYYNWILKRTDSSILEEVNNALASLIPDDHISTIKTLNMQGYDMSIISCGTGDLCIPPLKIKEVGHCFSFVESNFFHYKDNMIHGMKYSVLKGEDKVYHAKKRGLDPEKTVVVGDGYTDIPLLDWSCFPVLIDPLGEKRKKLSGKNYHFIDRISQLTDLVNNYNLQIWMVYLLMYQHPTGILYEKQHTFSLKIQKGAVSLQNLFFHSKIFQLLNRAEVLITTGIFHTE